MIVDLRADVSSRETTIMELKESRNNDNDDDDDNDVFRELEKTKSMMEKMRIEHELELKTVSEGKEIVGIDSGESEDTPSSTGQLSSSSRSLDINLPAGVVRARIAMAASRAMKQTTINAQQSYVAPTHSVPIIKWRDAKSPSIVDS